jgi:hypothetical protein
MVEVALCDNCGEILELDECFRLKIPTSIQCEFEDFTLDSDVKYDGLHFCTMECLNNYVENRGCDLTDFSEKELRELKSEMEKAEEHATKIDKKWLKEEKKLFKE